MDYRLTIVVLLAVLAAGCQTGAKDRELLEAENRRLEDRVYQLEDDLFQHCDLLDQLQRENDRLRNKVADDDDTSDDGGNVGPPQIDLGVPDVNGGKSDPGPPPRFEGGEAPAFPRLDAPREFFPVASAANPPSAARLAELRAASNQVTRITLDRLLPTVAGQTSDDGLTVVVEPRDATGQLISATGDVSVVVLDASQPPDAARLARWDFPDDEAAARFQRTALGERMRLDLAWPDAPPPESNLRVFVRFTTADGRKLIAEAPIELQVARGDRNHGARTASAEAPLDDASSSDDESASGDADASSRNARKRPRWTPYR
jgi:hypothetical protein